MDDEMIQISRQEYEDDLKVERWVAQTNSWLSILAMSGGMFLAKWLFF